MNFLTQALHLLGSGSGAYIMARNLRDPQTRPNTLAGLQLAESGSVPMLSALSQRAAAEGDTWLSNKLATHAADEHRHGQIFAHALKQLNKQVIDFKQVAQTNPKDKSEARPETRQRSPFFEAYFDGYSQDSLCPEQIDWLVFMASTYILELDASKDFARMAKALPLDDLHSANLRKGMLSIAQDETGHAAYLYEALHRRLPHSAVAATVEEWRTRKVNALLAMVGNLFQGHNPPSLVQEGPPPQDLAALDLEDRPEIAA